LEEETFAFKAASYQKNKNYSPPFFKGERVSSSLFLKKLSP